MSIWCSYRNASTNEERSTRGCTKRPVERAEEAKSEAGKYGRIEASEDKRSGKGGSYDLTESICQ